MLEISLSVLTQQRQNRCIHHSQNFATRVASLHSFDSHKCNDYALLEQQILSKSLEDEKMLRIQAEAKLREVHQESENCKSRLAALQEEFQKMEEMVKNLLQFKSHIDHLKHEKSSLTIAYENKLRKYKSCVAALEKENIMLLNELKALEVSSEKDVSQCEKGEKDKDRDRSLSRILLERLRLLEQENSTLLLESEQQRLQYEKCLDDVANQVVQALLAQKNLREECIQLHRRVQELEQQNQFLSLIFNKHFLFSQSSSSRGMKSSSELTSDVPNWPHHEFIGNLEFASPLGFNPTTTRFNPHVLSPNSERKYRTSNPNSSTPFGKLPRYPLMTRSLSANSPNDSGIYQKRQSEAAFPCYLKEKRLKSSKSVDEDKTGSSYHWLEIDDNSSCDLSSIADLSPVKSSNYGSLFNNVIRHNGGSAGISCLSMKRPNTLGVIPHLLGDNVSTLEEDSSKSLSISSAYDDCIDRPPLGNNDAFTSHTSDVSSSSAPMHGDSDSTNVNTVLRRVDSNSSHFRSHVNSATATSPIATKCSFVNRKVNSGPKSESNVAKLESRTSASNDKESPVSLVAENSVTELTNRDEGYSTMSSDVQSDAPLVNVDSKSKLSAVFSHNHILFGKCSKEEAFTDKMAVLREDEGESRDEDCTNVSKNVMATASSQSNVVANNVSRFRDKRNSFDPAYISKMMSLLTPLGYDLKKQQYRRTFPPSFFTEKMPFEWKNFTNDKVETAEKATSADFSDKELCNMDFSPSFSTDLTNQLATSAQKPPNFLSSEEQTRENFSLFRNLYLHINLGNHLSTRCMRKSASDTQLYVNEFNASKLVHHKGDCCLPKRSKARRSLFKKGGQFQTSSSLSTSSSAISDETDYCFIPFHLQSKGINEHSTDDQSTDEYDLEHKRFVHCWLQNESNLRWDDNEVTWKLNESLSMASKKSPLLDNWDINWDGIEERKQFKRNLAANKQSDLEKIEEISLVSSVNICDVKDDAQHQKPSSSISQHEESMNVEGDSSLNAGAEMSTFNSDFYRLCLVGSNKSIETNSCEDSPPRNSTISKSDIKDAKTRVNVEGNDTPVNEMQPSRRQNNGSCSRTSSKSPSKIPASKKAPLMTKSNNVNTSYVENEKSQKQTSLKFVNDDKQKRSITKSSSSTSAKSLSANTRIPQPKHSVSLDQIKKKEAKPKSSKHGIREPKCPKQLELQNSGIDVQNKSLSMSSTRVHCSEVPRNSSSKPRHSQNKSPKDREKFIRPKLVSEQAAVDVSPGAEDAASVPTVEELQRRLSEEREISGKIKELKSLFEKEDEVPKNVSNFSVNKHCSEKQRLQQNRRKRQPKEGHETSWVHVSGFGDFPELRAQATLMNTRKDYRSSSDSSSSDEDAYICENLDNKLYYQKLHALHRFRRQRKRASDRDMVISCVPRVRASIVDRRDFYYRFGEKEQEAVACFDFLEDISLSPTSPEHTSGVTFQAGDLVEEEKLLLQSCLSVASSNENDEISLEMVTSAVDHISLSDSCAENYDGSENESHISYAA